MLYLRQPVDFNWREACWVGITSLGFAAIFAYPMLCQLSYLGPGLWGWLNLPPDFSHLARFPANGDWDLFTGLRWVPYYTVTHFGQLPYWNPYRCGGMPMLGNPESGIVTPFFLLYLVFGPYAGLYLEIFLHLAIAFAGGYLLARVMGLTRLAAVVCAGAFPASSWFDLHLAVGHLNFLPAAYLPSVTALLLLAIDRKSMFLAALGGLVCALTFTEGNYTFLYAGIVVAILSLWLSISRLSVRPLIAGLMLGIFAAAFAALKMMPAWELLTIHPRPPFGPEYDDLKSMGIYLFSRNQDLYRGGVSVFLLSEYGAYWSPVFAVLAVLGIVGGRLIRTIPWVAGAILFFLLAQGDSGPHSALMLLRYLPMTHEIDLPARFIIGFLFCAGVLAAYGTDYLSGLNWRWAPRIDAVLVAAALLDSWMVGPPNLRYLFHNPVEPLPRAAEFHQYYVANPGNQTEIAIANMGSANCQGYGYCSIPTDVVAMNDSDSTISYRGEYYLLGPGKLVQTRWSPNRLSYDVNVPAPTTLVINQNYYPGWKVTKGNATFVRHGTLLAVALPQGHQRITLSFHPRLLLLSLALTLTASIATFLLWRWEAWGSAKSLLAAETPRAGARNRRIKKGRCSW
jgi:hypothetical protein